MKAKRGKFSTRRDLSSESEPSWVQCSEAMVYVSLTIHRCHPSLRCLPRVNDVYTCQPAPVGKHHMTTLCRIAMDKLTCLAIKTTALRM